MKVVHFFACSLCAGLCVASNENPPKLTSYNIDISKITVSGFSSGGFFAVQFHVAYSKIIRGVGVIAGGPFWCAKSNLMIFKGPCTKEPDKIDFLTSLTETTCTLAAKNAIDPIESLKGTEVYLLCGKYDSVVLPGVVKKLEEYYSHFVTDGNISSIFSLPAEHCFPTEDYGNNRTYLGPPFICNCNYSAAHEILKHVYPGSPDLKPSYRPENLFEFDQSEFAIYSLTHMDSIGYIYVPTVCQSKKTPCKLHIAFHGCGQGRKFVGTEFVVHTGYAQYAEELSTIVIFPQIISSIINPVGCWDWYGYTSPAYASKLGPQMVSVRKMLERVALT